MKLIATVLAFLLTGYVHASPAPLAPLAPRDLLQVSTYQPPSRVTSEIVYRAFVFYGGQEGAISLGVEKLKRTEYGGPDAVETQNKVYVTQIKGFKEHFEKMTINSAEAKYGCCMPKDLAWESDNKLSFKIHYRMPVYDRSNGGARYLHTDIADFACNTTTLDNAKIDFSCKKTKTATKVEDHFG